MFYKALRYGVFLAFAAQLWLGPSAAHMAMAQPPSINYKTNPNVIYGVENYDYTSPLSPSGSDFPCKGELKYMGTQAGASVANYAPGGTFTIKLDGQATHSGGSCQASLSYDKGATFTVIKSWVGDCPHAQPSADQTFTGQIPSNAPSGEVVFAWTWFNELGNREMYMNCAIVTIGGGKRRRRFPEDIPGSSNGTANDLAPRAGLSGPGIFIANVGNGCTTVASKDVVFPSPGSTIQYGGSADLRVDPSGTCDGRKFTGGAFTGGGTNSGSSPGDSGSPSGHRGDCTYWASQGYLCSSSPSSRAINPFSFSLTLLAILGLVA
ncbi:MAG: hypothetical protein M1839_004273 [Geoglossum umbratile]|nr:MAG: hypothetical protein M1839_004273 [Geoglossum umbratile]